MARGKRLRKDYERLVQLRAQLEDDELNAIAFNPTQWEFMNDRTLQVYLCGANQIAGKSTALNALGKYHLEGDYPEGWVGPKFLDRPPYVFALSVTNQDVKKLIADRLFGPIHNRGSGYLSRGSFTEDDLSPMYGVSKGAVKEAYVHHKPTGKRSTIEFASYKQGWDSLQGRTPDLILLDEEPPWECYSELNARLLKSQGYMRIAATPTWKNSNVLKLFKNEQNEFRRFIHYTIDKCTHLTEEQREYALKIMPEKDKAIRLYADPGEMDGRCYPFDREDLVVEPGTIPPHVYMGIGIDLNHTPTGTFAAVKLMYDPSSDVMTLITCRKMVGTAYRRADHIEELFALGGNRFAIEWPHDGRRQMDDGQPLSEHFRSRGLKMQVDAAHRPTSTGKSNSVRFIINELFERMADGRFKVWDTPENRLFFDEIEEYHTKDGVPAKNQEDHVIDALHKVAMGITWRGSRVGEATTVFQERAQTKYRRASGGFFSRTKRKRRVF